jgi:fido (protein-threonine AMPylation protein)/DNA-binding Lrp family transcriptional regulator
MATKWDCLFALFELKQARLSDIAAKSEASLSSTSQRMSELLREGLILKETRIYTPNRQNGRTWQAFDIMKFCRKRGVNYTVFLSGEFAAIIQTAMGKEEASLPDFRAVSPATARKYLTILSRLNLLFVVSKRPLKVRLVSDPVFDDVLGFHGLKHPKSPAHSPGPPAPIPYPEIGRLLKRFKTLSKTVDLSSQQEEQKIEFTSASTQLEGNTFTLEQSHDLLLNDLVPADKKLREANEVKNYFMAVNYLLSHLDAPISISYILDLHRLVVFNLGIPEGIRSSNVSIHGNPLYKVSRFHEIYPQLDALCKRINESMRSKSTVRSRIEFASWVHNEFQHIHPFEDGNSRVTRLLWNHVLLKSGFPLISIHSNARAEYLSHTKLSRLRDDVKLNAFLARVIQDNLYKMTRAGLDKDE